MKKQKEIAKKTKKDFITLKPKLKAGAVKRSRENEHQVLFNEVVNLTLEFEHVV